ncbi:GspE/PulE family protein [Zavarzinia aquatilis]|uniref:GspE/PulE family protein n=1 Tax=Zavarzinia aquatilis TaxID=2211142 RepID=UPI0010582739|nr:GspE/PulE family protein [Zavarzinia aquatilis]
MAQARDFPEQAEADEDGVLARLQGEGVLDDDAVQRLRRVRGRSPIALVDAVTQLGLLAERELAGHLGRMLGLAVAGPERLPAEAVEIGRVSPQFLRERRVVPLAMTGDALHLAVVDPFDRTAADGLRLATRRRVVLEIAAASDVEEALARLYARASEGPASDGDTTELDLARLRERASDAPVIRLVDGLLSRAVEARASDIHLQPQERRLRVRMRIDGVLRDFEPVSGELAQGVVSRLKILAGLDIAERRLPQDGAVKLVVRGREIDLRIAFAPAVHGEAVVVRILDRGHVALDFDALGFAGDVRHRLTRLLARPSGILLVTGPTGSGKSTTLYAALNQLNGPERNIVTVEDPVENKLDGITQIQVKPDIGLTFARVLRSVLRLDPDVIMIGEIRDPETAQIATQAALTGHLVLATLHTNSAAAAVTRLLDMGVDDYLIASTVSGVLAQRLVRKLCPECRVAEAGAFRAGGCATCNMTGYRGRIAIHELLTVDEPLRRAVVAKATAGEIEAIARAAGMETLGACGLRLVAAGITSRAEVERVAIEDQE